ncbi:MAG: hypothetical protein U5L04_16935 [Trueperaceae bacterium]|nr:hypothetical protein [Trueperaceae bacterium]
MAKKARGWYYSPKKSKPKIPEALKQEVETRARDLVENHLKPEYVVTSPENERFNYITDIWVKWYRSYLYFCAMYRSTSPDALSPEFEVRFARLEYAGLGESGEGLFHLAYMRHTGQWWEIFRDLPLQECLDTVRDLPHFRP